MNTYLRISIFVYLLVALFIGCEQQTQIVSSIPIDNSNDPLIPLAIGNSWYYKDIYTTDSGTFMQYYNISIKDTEYFQNRCWYLLYDSRDTLNPKAVFTISNDSILYPNWTEGGFYPPPQYLKPTHTEIVQFIVLHGCKGNTRRATKVKNPVILPRGYFRNCVKFQNNPIKDNVYEILCPGVGIIEDVDLYNKPYRRTYLISYRLY